VDRTNPDILFAVFSGYGTGHVYRSSDRGVTWTDISGNLPDMPVNGIVQSRDKPASVFFIGTDIGVWYTEDSGANWARFGNGLPNVVVYDIDIDSRNRLIAATHGRGMWITDAVLSAGPTTNVPTAFAVTQNYPNPFTASTGTTISFTLKQSSDVSLKLYDATGRLLQTIAEGRFNVGAQSVRLDASSLRPGVYFYALSNGEASVTRKLVVM
jgi:photosystem II stability/assembly factor-like uncharacterized protein